MSNTGFEDVLAELSRCIVAMGPYQREVVLSGGLVPLAYRSALPKSPTRLRPLTTFDVDFTLPQKLKEQGARLHDRLSKSDFWPLRTGSEKLPVTKYLPKGADKSSPIYIEFVTQRSGGKTVRGVNQGVVEVQKDLHAQTDPYVGLLLCGRFEVKATDIVGVVAGSDDVVHLPDPLCYIIQKALIRKQRSSSKRDNDACHIFDVMLLTRSNWSRMKEFGETLTPNFGIPPKWINDAFATLDTIFTSTSADGVVAVQQNYPGEYKADDIVAIAKAFLSACRIVGTKQSNL